ncbi:MAG: hypothetical protein RIC38_06970 [Chromatocurvus sp.]
MQERHSAVPRQRRLPSRQAIKLVVYLLLLVNFTVYVTNDWTVATHTMRPDWSLLQWARAFATTLDELAWFALLMLFELETYLLEDESFTRARVAVMHGLRIACFLFIAHTVYAFADYALDLQGESPVPADTLCRFTDAGVSYARNLTYTPVDAGNCDALSEGDTFYRFQSDTLVTDAVGMRIERELAWVDVAEVIAWLFILVLIELQVRLQDRGITGGRVLRTARWSKAALYALLWCAAAYWLYRGHWVFAWDEALWILGFMAIDMNMEEWRDEIVEARA